MSKKETKDRITREKEMLPEMVKIYCHGVHKTKRGELCPECRELCDYALYRLDHCRWGMKRISAPSARAIAISPSCAKR